MVVSLSLIKHYHGTPQAIRFGLSGTQSKQTTGPSARVKANAQNDAGSRNFLWLSRKRGDKPVQNRKLLLLGSGMREFAVFWPTALSLALVCQQEMHKRLFLAQKFAAYLGSIDYYEEQ